MSQASKRISKKILESELPPQEPVIPDTTTVKAKFSGKTPYNNGKEEEWHLDAYDIQAIAAGAGLLGTGGGGSPYLGRLRALAMLRSGKSLRILRPESFTSGRAVMVAFMGAPTVINEKLISGRECADAVHSLETISGSKASALLCAEIGGCNSMEPLALASELGLPVLDCDGMGRAFPELQMVLPFMLGERPTPAVLVDEKGTSVAVMECETAKDVEDIFRVNLVHFMG